MAFITSRRWRRAALSKKPGFPQSEQRKRAQQERGAVGRYVVGYAESFSFPRIHISR